MSAPVQIRNPEVAAKVRELASIRHRSITDLIDELVTPALDRERELTNTQMRERRKRIEETLARLQAMPVTGREPDDSDLYDEYGLPK